MLYTAPIFDISDSGLILPDDIAVDRLHDSLHENWVDGVNIESDADREYALEEMTRIHAYLSKTAVVRFKLMSLTEIEKEPDYYWIELSQTPMARHAYHVLRFGGAWSCLTHSLDVGASLAYWRERIAEIRSKNDFLFGEIETMVERLPELAPLRDDLLHAKLKVWTPK